MGYAVLHMEKTNGMDSAMSATSNEPSNQRMQMKTERTSIEN